MNDLIIALPRILTKRSAEREQKSSTRRLLFTDPNPLINSALEKASWKLNEGGYRSFHRELKAAENKKQHMIINGTKIDEKYIGRKTAGYVGHYETDGKSCNCSWFNSRKLCRHLFVYREYMKVDLFDTNIFPTSFLKHSSIENSIGFSLKLLFWSTITGY